MTSSASCSGAVTGIFELGDNCDNWGRSNLSSIVPDLKANGTTRPYAYAPNTNRHTGLGNQVITLDAAGNTTLDRNGNRVFTYNHANRLTQVSINGVLKGTYTYNYLNQRTRKVRATAPGGTSTFLYHYDINGNLIAETRPNGKLIRSYLWADNEPIAQIQTKGTNPEELSYVHNDHLNTPRLATNHQQSVVWRFESEAFGTGKPDTDPDADETKTNLRLRFPGQYADGESGLYYNWNRYYDPKVGRYISSDPIGLKGGLNTYAYVDSNPLKWVDPEGLSSVRTGSGARRGGGRPPTIATNEKTKLSTEFLHDFLENWAGSPAKFDQICLRWDCNPPLECRVDNTQAVPAGRSQIKCRCAQYGPLTVK